MKYTTLNKIRAHSPCEEGWTKLLKHLRKSKADDEPLPFEVILDSNGLDDALWCTRSAPEYDREWRLFAVWCARQVQHLNTDPRVSTAIDATEDFANGLISDAARNAARDTARNAAWAARNAAWAAWAAAWAAAGAAARAAGVAARNARNAARAAARDTASDLQSDVFRWVVNGGLTKFERWEE